jgi:hypothetical protein
MVAFLVALPGTPDSAAAQQCMQCNDDEDRHYFDDEAGSNESFYKCGDCHTYMVSGNCEDHHEECFQLVHQAEQLATAIRIGDRETARQSLRELASGLELVPDRQVVQLRGCGGEYIADFSLTLPGFAELLLEVAPSMVESTGRPLKGRGP